MIKNSRGLSTIVATLLIILLVLVAVGIVWFVVRSVLQENSEKISIGRITVNLEITTASVIDSENISVTVRRNPGRGELFGILFIAYDNENSELTRRNISMKELEEKGFKIVLSVINTSLIKKVSIAPIFITESGKEIIGDIQDEYIFPETGEIECGDGLIEGTEDCDDGDTSSGDGCSAVCVIESGWTCSGQPSVCILSNGGHTIECGDGIREGTEGCDDGDDISGDGCSSDCTVEYGWTCDTQTPNVCIYTEADLYWTGELMVNGGFEEGNLYSWFTPQGPEWAFGSYPPEDIYYVMPQAGDYCVYYDSYSNISYYIHQDVSLVSYAAQIDSGIAVINASGWGVSSEYPERDLTRIQIIFLSSTKQVIGTALDTGYKYDGDWWKAEVVKYPVPAGTRYVRMWANTYEDCVNCKSGSIDSFSVTLGYSI